jgi:1-acyl-sn-glycerol-3-phosphate acyltransferase
MGFYSRIYKIFAKPLRALYRIRTVGEENIPEGAAIIAANHLSFSDVLVISSAAHRQVRYMAKAELFKTPLKPLLDALGAFPIDRSRSDVGAIRKSIKLLRDGKLVGIFPQGHRRGRKDPRTTEIKHGVGMIAFHSRASVIPVFIDNKGLKTRMFKVNTVIFGKPIKVEDLAFKGGGKAEYLVASRKIFRKICELKYGPFEDWDDKFKEPFLVTLPKEEETKN